MGRCPQGKGDVFVDPVSGYKERRHNTMNEEGEREAGSSSVKHKTEEEKGKSRIRKIPKVHRKEKKKNPPSFPNCPAPTFGTGSLVFQVSFKLGSYK